MNPYSWQKELPPFGIERTVQGRLLGELRRGAAAVVAGGPGAGKSVPLRALEEALGCIEGVRVLRFPAPPTRLTVEACQRALAESLGLAGSTGLDSHELLTRFFERPDAPAQLVLLYDEFDGYARVLGQTHDEAVGPLFFNELEVARRGIEGLSIAVAGSIGVFAFREVSGSSFLGRATRLVLDPFDRTDLELLAQPFAQGPGPLDAEVLDALFLASGGIPALATYGLQQLWDRPDPEPRDVADAFGMFRQDHGEFVRAVQMSYADPGLSEVPARVLERIQRSDGRAPRAELDALCTAATGALRLDTRDVLDLLRASGLIRVEGAPVLDDPVLVRPVASILGLPEVSGPSDGLRERLLADLELVLQCLHASSADFFRPGRERGAKQIVPEAVFSAYLQLGLQLLGWTVDREAQLGVGRTDLKLIRPPAEGVALVEVKLWGRADHREVVRQLESYWSSDVVAGAAVVLTDRELGDWSGAYQAACLAGTAWEAPPAESAAPLRGRFSSRSRSPAGFDVRLEHFLLALARR